MPTESSLPRKRHDQLSHSWGIPFLTCEMASEEGKYSEQEEKEWEKKKRTRERVSTLMGQYLLKGYRMLNINCAECGVRWLFYVRMRICLHREVYNKSIAKNCTSKSET